MPILPGIIATPTVLLNAALSLLPERSLPVAGPDRVAVITPMLDEESTAQRTLASILAQTALPNELVISLNGCRDGTDAVVSDTLRHYGYAVGTSSGGTIRGCKVTNWEGSPSLPKAVVLTYEDRTSKAESINAVVRHGLIESERILVVDGDTVLDRGFVEALLKNLYRIYEQQSDGAVKFVVEDVALQSGAPQSLWPGLKNPIAGLISLARSAEYSISSVLRRGQSALLGKGPVFGRSRLYTAVGCGFMVRRDAFPMPYDTLTEDHDLTLDVQNGQVSENLVEVPGLDSAGFRVLVDGATIPISEYVGPAREVLFRRSGNARFVGEAFMWTEDPPHLDGFVRQIERWTSGGVQNALKRLLIPNNWKLLSPNVRFTVIASQVEHVFGIILLLVPPIALGIHVGLPDVGLAPTTLAKLIAIDFVITFFLATIGFIPLAQRRSTRFGQQLLFAVLLSLRTAAPLFVLRLVNAACYVAAASRVLLVHRARAQQEPRRNHAASAVWNRPHKRSTTGFRSRTVVFGGFMLAIGMVLYGSAALHTRSAYPGYREAWELTFASTRLRIEDFTELPLPRNYSNRPGVEMADVPNTTREGLKGGNNERGEAGAPLSQYCPALADSTQDFPLDQSAKSDLYYAPLSGWELILLGRLAPILGLVEQAAASYGVPARLLLAILVNESFLDPLAVGPDNDLGLSQLTSDALSLIHAISTESTSDFVNPLLFGLPASVYDPDFSICAGAAKLAWARAQPLGHDDDYAYARYINPIRGVLRGQISPEHETLVAALNEVAPIVDRLVATIHAYRVNRAAVTQVELAILNVAHQVLAFEVSVGDAYFLMESIIPEFGIADRRFYPNVLRRLYSVEIPP